MAAPKAAAPAPAPKAAAPVAAGTLRFKEDDTYDAAKAALTGLSGQKPALLAELKSAQAAASKARSVEVS